MRKEMKINVVTLCSGYDSQALALERIKRDFPDFDYELIAWAEYDPESKAPSIDKQPAVIAHNALFPQWSDRNMGDITKADWSVIKEPIDLLCYSTPCQSISNVGLQHGFKEGSGTRSSVIWSVLNAIKTLRPLYLLMENVAAMVQSKFIKDFHEWQNAVASLGYAHYTEVLNAKDYGVPQNRERVFMVSVRNDVGLRYHFPQPFKLDKRLKDVLEVNVDEKYYLSDKMIHGFVKHNANHEAKGTGFKFKPKTKDDIAVCIRANSALCPTDNVIKEVGRISSSQNSRVINPDGISYAMANGEKDGAPKIVEQCDTSFFNTQEE